MMHFDLQVNGEPITRVSVVRQQEHPENGSGWFVYDWTAWHPDPNGSLTMNRYATDVLAHRYDDGIEALAIKVLAAYRAKWADGPNPDEAA